MKALRRVRNRVHVARGQGTAHQAVVVDQHLEVAADLLPDFLNTVYEITPPATQLFQSIIITRTCLLNPVPYRLQVFNKTDKLIVKCPALSCNF